LQIIDINLKDEILTIPHTKTKNGNEARFKLDSETLTLLKQLISGYPEEWYIFGGRNKPAALQVCSDYFGQNWRAVEIWLFFIIIEYKCTL